MKTKLSLFAIGALFLSTSWMAKTPLNEQKKVENKQVVSASVTPEFSFFRTHRQGKSGATSTWGLSSENDAVHYTLERTYEDPTDPYASWETICMQTCSNARSYKFTDNNIFPGFISYRVKVSMTDGTDMMSGITTVHIVSH